MLRNSWQSIAPLPEMTGEIKSILNGVDALKMAWEEVQATASAIEVERAFKRRLRRHAIETGIIERLYDLSWGVTETLVAEGLTSEVAATEGGISEPTLRIIQDQLGALEYLIEWVQLGHPLSAHFIRTLHQLIVQHQPTYEGRAQVGDNSWQIVQIPLKPGKWKEAENNIHRHDGSVLEFAPPLLVEEEIQRLVQLYEESVGEHPIVRAAWLHHRFVQIHPFADGNGRVARALTLLALQRDHFAPIVVDRGQRTEYIEALEQANSADLGPLVRFLARLEERALRAELQTPLAPDLSVTGAVAVARAYASRLKVRDVEGRQLRKRQAEELAGQIHSRLLAFLEPMRVQLQNEFREADSSAVVSIENAIPPDPRATYWHGQLVKAARLADFHANLAEGSWWVRLHFRLRSSLLRFIVAVQKVGRGDTGVLALTVHAELRDEVKSDPEDPISPQFSGIFDHGNAPDSVTFVYTDDSEIRWAEVERVVEAALSAAIGRFAEQLS
jgi:prophage maintenance system killer protein